MSMSIMSLASRDMCQSVLIEAADALYPNVQQVWQLISVMSSSQEVGCLNASTSRLIR